LYAHHILLSTINQLVLVLEGKTLPSRFSTLLSCLSWD
jgi:hypothetical protein